MTRAGTAALLCSAALLAGAAASPWGPPSPAAFAGDAEKPKREVDPADVYYGDATKWEKPAEVKPDDVYAQIEEYKEIVKDGLKPGDPRYDILMAKASKRFVSAVKKAAKNGGYDLVARSGSVKGVEKVPDVTQDVIANL